MDCPNCGYNGTSGSNLQHHSSIRALEESLEFLFDRWRECVKAINKLESNQTDKLWRK